ncbi:MAG: hypothetical protein KatS3mg110_0171 [Pirellulaceae bacterium]|nr:MAG: hypothetical protein KatS3mg110_0171 [Pirellulaceae bacterium]
MTRWKAIACVAVAWGLGTLLHADEPPLRPWPENPWYWSYHGQPVLLIGGSDDDNLFQWPEAELVAHLDRLAEAGGNVIRNTMSDRKDKGFEIYPFRRVENGKYDLESWNDEYWERFERLLRETARRRIFVQIEVWDRFDYTDHGGRNSWQQHPYNPANNVNYTYEESGFAPTYPEHAGANKQPFFFTTPRQRNNVVVLKYQQRFVNKLLDHALKYDHVLYCIDNETSGDEEWGRYWAEFIRQRAHRENRQVFITEMWDDWSLKADRHKRTFDHPELYGFVEVSQNNHNKGQTHWDNLMYVRKYISSQPRPMNNTKIYGATGNKFGHTDQDGIERFWRNLLAGCASARFHRPDSGLGLGDKAVACLRAARKVESLVPFWLLEPANELLVDREENEAYAAARPGQAYVVYFPSGGEVRLDPKTAAGRLVAQWINIDSGQLGPQATVEGGRLVRLSPPDKQNWVVVLRIDERPSGN